MFRKMNTRYLLIIFAALLGLVLLKSLFDSKKGDRSFKSELIEIDTSKVKSISITARDNVKDKLTFEKVDGTWLVSQGDKEYKADKSSIDKIISTLADLKTKGLVATKKDSWTNYEVTDSLATRVVVSGKKSVMADVLIGKLNYQQPNSPQGMMNNYGRQQPVLTTYVRNYDETKTYEVDGFLGMTFNVQLSSFRDKTVINSNANQWKRLTFKYPSDSSFTLTNDNNNWMVNGMVADSTKLVTYINKLMTQNSSSFVDDVMVSKNNPLYSLRIDGDNMETIKIKAYQADSVNGQYISSSQNKDVLFSGAKGGLTKNIFVSKQSLYSNIMIE